MKKPLEMHIHVVGVNHSTTPIEIRERLAVSSAHVPDALSSLRKYVSQGLILSTCNRTEVYSIPNSGGSSQPGIDFLKDWANISNADLLPYIYCYHNEEAVRHLFRVASGLDSMIIGEFEILGQVKQSLEEAKKTRMLGHPIRNLFHQALRVGRRVRDKTGISKNALSVSSVAVTLAAKAIGDLTRCKALVIGTGEAGRLVAKALKERGIAQITTTSRSYDKASTLAAALGGSSADIGSLGRELASCDIAISCTGAPHLILDLKSVENAMQTRPHQSLVIIDIAVPRDVEPQVGQISNVFLYDIDDFTHLSELNRKQRETETKKAMEIIESEVKRFNAWWQAMEVEPVISSLMIKAEDIRQTQLDMTLKKLRHLSPEEQQSLEAMTKAIVQKILHEPIQHLKTNTRRRDDYIILVNDIFQLDEDKPE
ncbi:MAG: glutamyl-tRNA reductase [Chloroflexi bacterium]|nr:glutamyl-tRNA reductase [Chloroflexota bacterium]MBL7061605.1 glutamyl-tRNA reductase [Dehalococcoidia bacterium]